MIQVLIHSAARSLNSRHGARLDAVDRQWHLSSATPYDPPLTYGGWKQSQALGKRIADILYQRATIQNPSTSNDSLKQVKGAVVVNGDQEVDALMRKTSRRAKRRKYNLLIHTSPFLRCVQTSIGISAGIVQRQTLLDSAVPPVDANFHIAANPLHSSFPHVRGSEHWNSPYLSAISKPHGGDAEDSQTCAPPEEGFPRLRLRLDAFLGEWLSPEYFEMITVPPDSKMMVAGAKADLLKLRQNDHVENVKTLNKGRPNNGNFPGGWGSSPLSNDDLMAEEDNGPSISLSEIQQSLPELTQSKGNVSDGADGQSHQLTVRSEAETNSLVLGYTPPIPAYAISPSEPIPVGYVAHARDACVDVDYQWDSMRLPHDWGDGGQIGEEWSSMHKRFRRGLQNMITWYRNCQNKENQEYFKEDETLDDDDLKNDGEETDTVLVLVTHGAGCNALIGAITNQPFLLDVGMASLTMAERKEGNTVITTASSQAATAPPRRGSLADSGISEDYQVKIVASTDHLRSSTPTSSLPRSQRSTTISSPAFSAHRHRSSSGISITSSGSLNLDRVEEDQESQSNAHTPTSNGLWAKPVRPIQRIRTPEPLREPIRRSRISYDLKDEQIDGTSNAKAEATGQFATHRGLWGAPPQAVGTVREMGPKRRWTHSDH